MPIPILKPMLATLTDGPFDDNDFIFEIKWDGYRALAKVEKKKVSLYSRNLQNFNDKYPSIVKTLEKVKESALFDGEIVAYNQKNLPSFQLLQNLGSHENTKIEYVIFDLLYLNGKSLLDTPLIERKKILEKFLSKYPALTYGDYIEEKGVSFFKTIVKKDMEGIMAKRKDSLYVPHSRSGSWLKIKHHHTEEAIIVGFTKPRGSRVYFGALVLGQYKVKDEMTFVGHTGTGFNTKMLQDLYKKMKPLITSTSPFKNKIPLNAPITWVKPKLVAEIKFTEWTEGGAMRHPVFIGLREDKETKEISREKVKKYAKK
jgi:bifunctional non-homologous end joining protein LigD